MERAALSIAVQPPGQELGGNRGLTDLKSLSGGERSFVTICFLLALGSKLKANFHCLDEFDVFMDSINRGVRRPLAPYTPPLS
jgi:chromosome segregation ATPase